MAPIIIGAFILLLYFAFLWKYDKELQKESDYLDKREAVLEERYSFLNKELIESKPIEVWYYVSDSDIVLFDNKKLIVNGVKKKLANVVAGDITKYIIQNFKMIVEEKDGKTRIGYRLKIKEEQ